MNLVDPVPALLSAIVLFLGPGALFLSLLPARERDEIDLSERLFYLAAVGVCVAAWVALVLAELSVFSLVRAASIVGAACVAIAFLAKGRLSHPLGGAPLTRGAAGAFVVLALAFGLQARPSEYLLGGRDPGTYIAAMSLIGRTGAIGYVDPLIQAVPAADRELFFREEGAPDFTWARFMGFPLESPTTARVFPEFFHLFPAFGAYLFQAVGVKGALATPPVFGILGTLAVFFALRRIFDGAVALLGSTLLAVSVVQVWFARYPVSETLSQFLFFLAVLAIARWEERGSAAFGALAGAALGLSLLVRIDGVLLLGPLALYLLVRITHHDMKRREALSLLVPLALLAGHAGVHAALFSRKYVLNIVNRPYWRQPALVWTIVAFALVLAGLAVVRYGPRVVELLERHRSTLVRGASALVVGLALYAYFVRPYLSALAFADGNPRVRGDAPTEFALRVLAPLGFHRLAAHDAQAFSRLGWFLSPLALLLSGFGLVRLFRAWRARALFFTLASLGSAVFYFYKLRIWNDYFFALRRFVPVIAPAVLAFAAFATVELFRRSRRARPIAIALGALLLGLVARETWPIARFVDWRNSVRFVDDVARRFTDRDVVIFEQRASIHLLSLPLWAVHGTNVIELARFNPGPAKLQDLIESWRGKFGNIYFVRTYRTNLCGVFLQNVTTYGFGTEEWERAEGRQPVKPESRALRFTIERVVFPEELSVPALSAVDVGGSDDFQVSGFFNKELAEGGRSYRWTGACGTLYAPGARMGGRVTVTATGDKRPATRPATVMVSLSGTPLGAFPVEPGWHDYSFDLPATLQAGPALLRFDVVDARGREGTFRPVRDLRGASDDRDLGVAIDSVRFAAADRRGAAIEAPR